MYIYLTVLVDCRVAIMTAATPITAMIDVVLAATAARIKYYRGGEDRDTRSQGVDQCSKPHRSPWEWRTSTRAT